jgi:hypothetical protein
MNNAPDNTNLASLKSNESEEIMFMYDKLRTEIMHNDLMAIQTLGGILVIITAALGFAVNGSNSALFKIGTLSGSIFLLLAGMKQTLSRVRGTFLIASYIRRYLEPHTKHIWWELRLKEFRLINEKSDYFPLSNILTTYSLLAIGVVLLTFKYLLFSFYSFKSTSLLPEVYDLKNFNQLYAAVPLMLICLLVGLYMVFFWKKEYRDYIDCRESVFKSIWAAVDDTVNSQRISNTNQITKV